MNDKTIKKSYWSITPANVRYCKGIVDGAKLLYGEISALCNEKGFCWASNDYFADLYGNDKRTIQRWIKSLEKEGFIYCQVKGVSRKMFLAQKFDFNPEDLDVSCETEEAEPEVKKEKKATPKKVTEKQVVKFTAEDHLLAEYLYSRILYNFPHFENKKVKLDEWADDIRKLREIDKARPDQIHFMITWVQGGILEIPGKPPRVFEPNDFWAKNIMSAGKLRKQWFDHLVPQLQENLKKTVKKQTITQL